MQFMKPSRKVAGRQFLAVLGPTSLTADSWKTFALLQNSEPEHSSANKHPGLCVFLSSNWV